jgi:lysophospholipase L1-like esterase
MPDSLKPALWWLMIGTNDVIKADCNVDTVVAGIITMAQEIMRRDEINRRQSHVSNVVINSLFPRVTLDADPLWKSIQEINQRLDCYASTTDGIEFFDATTLYINEITGKVDPDAFLEDGIHLTAHGLRLWEEAIVLKTLSFIDHHF